MFFKFVYQNNKHIQVDFSHNSLPPKSTHVNCNKPDTKYNTFNV